MAKAIYTLVFSAISLAHILHGEQLVFPEGEEHSILCTAPDEDNFAINWGTGGGIIGNEGPFTVGDEEPATNGTKGRRVIFNASLEVNQTTLRCVVVNFRPNSDSPEPLDFTIIIQGPLPAPGVDYTIREDGSIQFSWSPPFSHNITDVEPDISHYLVTIINMEDHHSVLTVNTTDTEYLLQSQDCQLSDYQVEIAAVNVVGVGDKYTRPPLTLDVVTVSNTATVTFGGKTPEITFQLQFRRNCNKETSFDLDLMPTFTQQLISISVTSQQFQPTLTLQSGDIQLNELYDVTLTVDGTSTFELSLSTFDVQNVEVRLTNTEYEITCYFASGSEARVVRIVLINDEGKEGKSAMHKDWRGLEKL
ncbi:hypothetical protein GBAR_LOCUS2686 [Geodia barretti]|uniref:Fibronectin type-III domain-containing protein n=1 Tax=Geodia barretti TaxID=519541 RepID=A0AA35W784_GEOBA|nr:hypothetical protein GBAR_LOCUS2686 [Geodia barretti]